MYAGDDIPDYEVMTRVGLPVAPADAAPEIKEIAKYISSRRGGEGVARDVIEQTMRRKDTGSAMRLLGGKILDECVTLKSNML